MSEWKWYGRVNTCQMRPYVPGEDMSNIWVSATHRENGSPKEGDMIARNLENHEDLWLVPKEYCEANFKESNADEQLEARVRSALEERGYSPELARAESRRRVVTAEPREGGETG